MKKYFLPLLTIVVIAASCGQQKDKKETTTATVVIDSAKEREVWTKEKANDWYATKGWLAGSNFSPSTAINQLEFWQAETFDTATIDKELGYAEGIGFNVMRVFLHHLAWQVDKEGFKNRMNTYLSIADKHHVQTMFVFFDDCWDSVYQAGKQRAPKPGIHNSGWVEIRVSYIMKNLR